jgi:hypothetical protein
MAGILSLGDRSVSIPVKVVSALLPELIAERLSGK